MKDYLLVGSDGSGEKSTKRGGWMKEQWKVRKGWIKVVIMGCKNKKGKKYVMNKILFYTSLLLSVWISS